MTIFNRISTLLLGLIGTPIISACDPPDPAHEDFVIGGQTYSTQRLTQYKLPKSLREISGLAIDGSDRLFGHDDEKAIVYQIDERRGAFVKRFAVGKPVKADFEGMAISPDHFYLVTSSGSIFEFSEAEDGEQTDYRRYKSGIDCEVEGLTYHHDDKSLYVACKNLKKGAEEAIRIHRWSTQSKQYQSDVITVTYQEVRRHLPALKKIQPTGITTTAEGNFLLIAGRQELLIELDRFGSIRDTARLPHPKKLHPQTEGIVRTSDHRLVLADEGGDKGNNGKPKGRLSVYHPL